MKLFAVPTLAIVAAAPQSCTPQQQQQALNYVVIASSVGCLLADTVTGVAIDVSTIRIPAGVDAATSRTLTKWKQGQQISQTECARVAAALAKAQSVLAGQ